MVLTLEGPHAESRQWRFQGGQPIQIGRAEGNDVRLADGHVAHYHATLFFDGRQWTLCGLSCQGTYVDGVLCSSCAVLSGMTLQLGHHGPRLKVDVVC